MGRKYAFAEVESCLSDMGCYKGYCRNIGGTVNHAILVIKTHQGFVGIDVIQPGE